MTTIVSDATAPIGSVAREDGAALPSDCEKSPANGGLVEEKCGVFVSSVKGSDTGAGTRESPVKSVTQGVKLAVDSGKAWVFVCKGTYNETSAVKVEDRAAPLGVFGKLDCDSNWVAGTTRATVKGAADEFVFAFKNATVVIEGLDVQAADAVKPGGSSIAIFANGGELDVVDSVVKAGTGADGEPGGNPDPRAAAPDAGITATSGAGAADYLCKCIDADASTAGGGGGTASGGLENGRAGGPSHDAGPPNNGAGGLGNQTTCGANGNAGEGRTGADGMDGGSGANAAMAGLLTADRWTPAKGSDGDFGLTGQGGGGGGSRTGGGGGSGGCGGCGGKPGRGGGGGGASVAIASLGTNARVRTTLLSTAQGGAGGAGGAGQLGQLGGEPGNGFSGACRGGFGGNGGNGGAGGHGAGGLSCAALFKGGAVDLDTSTQTSLGDSGAPGGPGAFSSAPKDKFEAP